MIELRIFKTALRLDFTFFAVVTLFLLTNDSGYGVTALLSCAAHEMSHLLAMGITGAEVNAVTLYGAGIKIRSDNAERLPFTGQLAIYAAGCVMNFTLAAVLWVSGAYEAAMINLITALFNLLPIGELDGARLLMLAAVRTLPAERVDRVTRIASVCAALLAAVAILWIGGLSFSMAAAAAYIVFLAFFGE